MGEFTEKAGFQPEEMAKMAHGDGKAQAMALLLEVGMYDKFREAEKKAKIDGLETIHLIDALLGLTFSLVFSYIKKGDVLSQAIGTASMVDFIRSRVLRVADLSMEARKGDSKKQT